MWLARVGLCGMWVSLCRQLVHVKWAGFRAYISVKPIGLLPACCVALWRLLYSQRCVNYLPHKRGFPTAYILFSLSDPPLCTPQIPSCSPPLLCMSHSPPGQRQPVHRLAPRSNPRRCRPRSSPDRERCCCYKCAESAWLYSASPRSVETGPISTGSIDRTGQRH